MLNILVALIVWAKTWQNKFIKIHCNNTAVVSVLTSGQTKDLDLAAISRNISMPCAEFDIHLQVFHIEGKINTIVDTLSRWSDTDVQRKCVNSHIANPKFPLKISKLIWQYEFCLSVYLFFRSHRS